MHLLFAIVLFFTPCILSGCLAEEHLVPKHGIVHSLNKRDLSAADAELILKALMSKLEHSAKDSELIHKKIGVDKEHYSYEPAMADKIHLTSMKEGEMKHLPRSQPMEYDYMKEKLIPLEKDGYEMKKDMGIEKDMMALLMKMKELSASKTLEDPYKKDMYHGNPEEKFITEKMHLSKEPVMLEKSEKMYGDIVQEDKFNDKDVSLAESLYHMKIAGDIETYPHIKMEPMSAMHDKKIAEEKLHFEDDHSFLTDETYLKKVDEIGKSLKEESHSYIKDDDIEGYLKKAVEDDKSLLYDPKLTHPEVALKTTETKALEEWKATHKDIFAIEGGIFSDEKLKMDGAHHVEGGISHEVNDELMKKLKESLAFDKNFKMEGPHHVEGGISHEISDELLKKLKESLAFDKDLKMEGAHHVEGGITHEMSDELTKKLKSLGLDKEHDELLHLSKELHKEGMMGEGSFAYEKAKEQAHKDVHFHLGQDELKKSVDETLSFGAKEKVHGTELMFEKGLTAEKAHGINDKIGSGIEKSLHGVHGEETLKAKETHAFDESFGFEMDKTMFGGKVPLDGEVKHGIAHDSSFAAEAEKSFKAHEEELMKKGKAYGTDSLLHKDKEIMESAEGHHIHQVMKDEEAHLLHGSATDKHLVEIGAEKEHKTLHGLKEKFFELLRRVLHIRKCHLVTMRPGELLSIVNCISMSKDPLLCEKFSMCEKKKPLRVIAALEKCQKETIPGEIKACTKYAPLYPSTEIPLKIFQCVALNTRELIPQEKKQMAEFEECARVIKAESCGRFKWFRGPH